MQRVEFTKEMRKDATILVPDMLPIHFSLLRRIFRKHGYNMEVLSTEGADVINTGLQYVHNDTCYPALLCIGQFIAALQSGKYDLNRTALLLTQTGGGCRASNYIHLLRKALEKAGLSHIPVISLSATGMEKNSGFVLTPGLIADMLCACLYGDALMTLKNQCLPYEVHPGETNALVEKWVDRLARAFEKPFHPNALRPTHHIRAMAREFDAIERDGKPRVKVGVVGEIYVKYSAMGNNHLEDFLVEQGCEVHMPGLLGFLGYCLDVRIDDITLYGGKKLTKALLAGAMALLTRTEKRMQRAIESSSRLEGEKPLRTIKGRLDGMLGTGCKMGEGWLLTAEMIGLIEGGVDNIVCVQPFGCLPNHIAGKGTIRPLRERFPKANIVPIDYDPSATRVNQVNRLKLMLAVARENLDTAE